MATVFISYAHENKELAIWLTDCLEATPDVRPWRDKQNARRGRVEDVIREVISHYDCGVFLISEHWLKSPFCRWEAERFAERGSEYCIPVYLEPHETLKSRIPPSLSGLIGVDGSGDRHETLWDLYSKIRNEGSGPEKRWKEHGLRLATAITPVAPAEMPIETRISDAEVFECDRDHEFKLVQKKYVEKEHHLFLIAGPKWEAHRYFVSKVEEKLTGHRPVRPTWRGGQHPRSESAYCERLSLELNCAPRAVPGKLRLLLEQQNVLLIHPMIDCDYDDAAIVACYAQWLPNLLAEAKPVHRVQCLVPVVWDVQKGLAAAALRWFRHEDADHEKLAHVLMKRIQDAKAISSSRIRLKPITEQHVHEFCDLYELSAADRARLFALLAEEKTRTSEGILRVVDEFMEDRRAKRVS